MADQKAPANPVDEKLKAELEAAKEGKLAFAVLRHSGTKQTGNRIGFRHGKTFTQTFEKQDWESMLKHNRSVWISKILHLPDGFIDPAKEVLKDDKGQPVKGEDGKAVLAYVDILEPTFG